ncbi:MAG: TetR/AcrR family transcriptional regulator [Alphaproteobacteria bacterium]
MVYRQTDKVRRRLAARHDAIVAAARQIAAEAGIAAVQIVPVAERAGVAAGTIYRYFPGKTELVSAVVKAACDADLAAMRRAAAAAPGSMSALVAAIVAFAARALHHRRLAWALLAEPAEPDVAELRISYRRAITGEIEARLRAASPEHVGGIDAALAAPAIVGAMLEALLGPLAPQASDPAREREAVQLVALFALRGAGIVDGLARGLIVQTPMVVEAPA